VAAPAVLAQGGVAAWPEAFLKTLGGGRQVDLWRELERSWVARGKRSGGRSGGAQGIFSELSLLGLDAIPELEMQSKFRPDRIIGVFIFIVGICFAGSCMADMHRFVKLLIKNTADARSRSSTFSGYGVEEEGVAGIAIAGGPADAAEVGLPMAAVATKAVEANEVEMATESHVWSIGALVGLTSYRFYTGFLSATWLPYLLAMEGQDLWPEKQSMFMGLAKLIYGATILLNPIFGLVGDQAVALSHSVGRRLFVRGGATVAAVGIYICVLSAKEHSFLSFLSGILVWRLGEALNDVTTEALVPEMVPQEQYQMASAIKASSFLLGGLFGYALLILFADMEYGWLYYAYPLGMFACAVPSLLLLNRDRPPVLERRWSVESIRDDSEQSFLTSVGEAYLAPTRFKGGFPRACLAVFVFSLGTAPMFFLLLIVRDLVGIQDQVRMQLHFSLSSIVFFLSAAAASCSIALYNRASQAVGMAEEEILVQRARLLVFSMIVFGLVVIVLPVLSLFEEEYARNVVFYCFSTIFGGAFGACFSLFQDMTWQLLPPDIHVANAMGFNVMSRLLGVGLGNFIAGIILEFSYQGERLESTEMTAATAVAGSLVSGDALVRVYSPGGYVIMCTCSGVAVLISAALARSATGVAARSELVSLRQAPAG